ncbi:MAG: transposase [Nitrosotalea sp.]
MQRQIEYKARWLGLPVEYVKAGGTSSKCAICGSKLVPEEQRKMFCPICKSIVDRDVNAAHNILLRGTRVVPDGAAGEAVMAEPCRREQVICLVDAAKSGDGINVPVT